MADLSSIPFPTLSPLPRLRVLRRGEGKGGKERRGETRRARGSSVTKAVMEGKRMEAIEEDSSNDFISKVLSSSACEVEPRVLVDGHVLPISEMQKKKASLADKMAKSMSQVLTRGSKKEVLGGADSSSSSSGSGTVYGEGEEKTEAVEERENPKSVYLEDLLREYKGDLYVPEEVFSKVDKEEVGDFEQHFYESPQISVEDFRKFSDLNQVEALVSRGMTTLDGKVTYANFVVELKDTPGQKELHQKRWALQVDEATAQDLLEWYTGPQREVEPLYTACVELPPATPNPVASTISSRMWTEFSALIGITAAAVTAGTALALALGKALLSGLNFTFLGILWPLTKPFLLPFYWLAQALVKGVAGLAVSLAMAGLGVAQSFVGDLAGLIASMAEGGARGLNLVFTDAGRFVASRTLSSALRTLTTMFFVLAIMAALAKFTLTRRTRDYSKWDIWQAIEFGQSKPQARVEGSTGVKFADVAGINEVVKELQELVVYLKDPQRFNTMGTKPPHGVLLEGPPGCGKTLLAKAIAGEAGVPFYQMAGSEFVEVLVGVGAARVRDLFKRAKVNRPSVVFIDEIDALGAARSGAGGKEGEGYDAGSLERETTLNQLLIELDGFDTGQGVIFLGATNRMDMLDAALLRPGRFDRKIAIRPPQAQGRLEVLQVHARNVNLSPSVELWTYAKNLPGWSGAEIAQLLQEAAIIAAQRGASEIEEKDMDRALDRITLGVERGGFSEMRKKPAVVRRMAVHETGLALTAYLLRRLENAQIEPPQRVSVIPRGETLSRAIFNRVEDESYLFERRPSLIHRLQVLLGGRAAEEVLFGHDTSSYTLEHLPDASWMAYKMVSIWNMGPKLAMRGVPVPWKRRSSFTGAPLGFEGGLYDDYNFTDLRMGLPTDDKIADMAKELLDETYRATYALLEQHKAALTKSIYVLLETSDLYGKSFDAIVDAYPSGTSVEVVENEKEPGSLPLSLSLDGSLEQLGEEGEKDSSLILTATSQQPTS